MNKEKVTKIATGIGFAVGFGIVNYIIKKKQEEANREQMVLMFNQTRRMVDDAFPIPEFPVMKVKVLDCNTLKQIVQERLEK